MTHPRIASSVVLLVWLALPLVIYSLTLIYAHRYIYSSVVPFAMLLALMLCESFSLVSHNYRGKKVKNTVAPYQHLRLDPAMLPLTGLLCFLLLMLSKSPPLVRHRMWEQGSTISSLFFRNFAEIIPKIPTNAVVHIYGLPRGLDLSRERSLFAPECSFIHAQTVRAWLNLTNPERHLVLAVHSESWYGPEERAVNLELKARRAEVDIIVRLN